MDYDAAKRYFRDEEVVEHYVRAANSVGLWRSEEKMFTHYFSPEEHLLELGCGAGRIAVGLWEVGFHRLTGVDYSAEMVREARHIAKVLDYSIPFMLGDARALSFADASFDGAIFGFNGLMQIPGRENRRMAMREVCRVLKPGGYFIFTGHDQNVHWNREYWEGERKLWLRGRQDPELEDFGDMWGEAPFGGKMYIHAAHRDAVLEDLAAAGLSHEMDVLRSDYCHEPSQVRDFADDCRFWVARKP